MRTRPWVDVSELRKPHDSDAEDAIMAASLVLYQMSGQKYGGVFTATEQYVCETTGAPTGCSWDPGVGAYWNPALGAYTYVQGTQRRSRLAAGGDIRLRGRPVRRIVQVSIAGDVVHPSQYELLDSAILHPHASVSWGVCSAPLVTYEYGQNPPALGRMAARRLADELIEAANGGDCALPSNVTSTARQGLSIQIFDPQDFLDQGKVGLYEVDLFLATVNPGKAKKRPKVFSPDVPRGYRRS